jgi:hypothetical protein
MGSIALTVLTITLGSFFIFVGQFKITSKISPEIHEDMVKITSKSSFFFLQLNLET